MKYLQMLIGCATLALVTFLPGSAGEPCVGTVLAKDIDANVYGFVACSPDPYKITEDGSLVDQLGNVNKELKLSKVAQHVGVAYVTPTAKLPSSAVLLTKFPRA